MPSKYVYTNIDRIRHTNTFFANIIYLRRSRGGLGGKTYSFPQEIAEIELIRAS